MATDTVEKYTRLNEYALRHLDPKMTITDAIEMLKRQLK